LKKNIGKYEINIVTENYVLSTGFTDRLRGKKISHHWGLSPYDPLEHCFNILSDLPGVKKESFILHDMTIVSENL